MGTSSAAEIALSCSPKHTEISGVYFCINMNKKKGLYFLFMFPIYEAFVIGQERSQDSKTDGEGKSMLQ